MGSVLVLNTFCAKYCDLVVGNQSLVQTRFHYDVSNTNLIRIWAYKTVFLDFKEENKSLELFSRWQWVLERGIPADMRSNDRCGPLSALPTRRLLVLLSYRVALCNHLLDRMSWVEETRYISHSAAEYICIV